MGKKTQKSNSEKPAIANRHFDEFARLRNICALLAPELRPPPNRDRARRPAHARDANGFDGGYRENRVRRRVGTGPRAARPTRRSARFAPLLEEGRLGASSRRDASRLGRHRREVLATGPTRGGAEGRPRRCRPQHIVPGAQEEAGQGAEEGEHPLEPPPPVCSNLPSRCPLPSSRAFTRSTVPVALTR